MSVLANFEPPIMSQLDQNMACWHIDSCYSRISRLHQWYAEGKFAGEDEFLRDLRKLHREIRAVSDFMAGHPGNDLNLNRYFKEQYRDSTKAVEDLNAVIHKE